MPGPDISAYALNTPNTHYSVDGHDFSVTSANAEDDSNASDSSTFGGRSVKKAEVTLTFPGKEERTSYKLTPGEVTSLENFPLGDRNVYVTKQNELLVSSPGYKLVHYGDGDDVTQLQSGERAVKASGGKHYYLTDKGSQPVERGVTSIGDKGESDSNKAFVFSPKEGNPVLAEQGNKLIKIAPNICVEVGTDEDNLDLEGDAKQRATLHLQSKDDPRFSMLDYGTLHNSTGCPPFYLSQKGDVTMLDYQEAEKGYNFKGSPDDNKYFIVTPAGLYEVDPDKPNQRFPLDGGKVLVATVTKEGLSSHIE